MNFPFLFQLIMVVMLTPLLDMQAQSYSIDKTENPSLRYFNQEVEKRKTPLNTEGKFINEEFPFGPNFQDFRKWKKQENPYQEEKKNSHWRLEAVQDFSWKDNNDDFIMWLGHATFLIRMGGQYLLTDPVFGKASLVHTRYSPLPFPVEQLPPIDLILLSHNHRDHFSKSSLKQIQKKNPQVKIFTGLKMERWLKGMFKQEALQTAGWYQQFEHDHFQITFLPTRHWAKRGLFDFNDQLWGAFVIKVNERTIYFGGDTGYGSHLREAGEWFQPDYVILGIGAYQPEWFMECNHISPTRAIEAFQEMKGKWMIPMHYGCFDLSNESLEDPIRVYKAVKSKQANASSFLHPVPGEIIWMK